jgi:Flp pilus assembly protein TadD
MNTVATRRLWRAVVACLCFASSVAVSQENKTVLGPKNEDLHAGAEALLAGDAEEGVRRTLKGLQYASSLRNRAAGLSNLCAGYAMLDQSEEALPWCDEAIELNDRHWRAYSNRALVYIRLGRLEEAEQDLQKAEELAPR